MGRSIRFIVLLTAALLVVGMIPTLAADGSPWRGEWIWHPTPNETNYFRQAFNVREQPVEAKLAITADNIYTLFINGKEVAHDEDWTTLETHDILPYVKPGKNVIAVLAVDPGAEIGALLVEGSINYRDGSFALVKSDASWKIATSEQKGWKEAGFNDSEWTAPKVIGKPPIGPWGGLEHPDLVPKISAKITDFSWKDGVEPGNDAPVHFKVTPSQKPVTTGPIMVRIFSNGEKVLEHWMDPPTPMTGWEAGKAVGVDKIIPLPSYLPKGEFAAQIAFPGMENEDRFPVKIGRAKKITAPAVQVLSLGASASGAKLDVRATIRILRGRVPDTGLYVQLYQGKELWYAQTVPMKSPELWKSGAQLKETFTIKLPRIPSGEYRLRICPHNAECKRCLGKRIILRVRGAVTGQNAKPLGYGVFTDRDGIPHRWHITRNGVNIWDGKPYVPVGAMYLSTFFGGFNVNDPGSNERHFKNDVEKLTMMKNAGITDVYLNPCCRWEDKPVWVWQRIADLFDELGFNYGLQLTTPLKPLVGYSVTMEDYNVPADKSGRYGVDVISGWFGKTAEHLRVMYAVFDTKTGDLIASGKADTSPIAKGIRAEVDVKLADGQQARVHFIPELEFHGDMHDYWNDVNDNYWARLGKLLGNMELGPRFRLFIDILDNEQSFRDVNRLLPNSPAFRAMLADDLKEKYGTAARLSAKWGITPAVVSFNEASRLVPIGRANLESTTGWAADFETGRQYRVDLKVSTMWHDMISFRDWSIRDYNNLVADRAKTYHNVPVVLKLTDTDSFTNDQTVGGFDGVGMEAYGSKVELIRGCGGGVFSRARRAGRTMWELVTETGLAEDYVGYPDPIRLIDELGAMVSIGAKGTFYFYLNAFGDKPDQGFYIFNLFCDPRQLGWMGAFSKLMKSSDALIEHDPDTDWMYPGVIAGQHGFAPFDPGFSGTIPPVSIHGYSGKWVVAGTTDIPTGERVIVNLEDGPATSIYGPTFEQMLSTNNVVLVGHRRDLGALSVDKYYTDEFATMPDGRTIQVLKPTTDARILGKTDDDKVFWMRVGDLTLYSKDDWQRSVREMAGDTQTEEFIPDIIGAEVLDLGPAFQAITNGTDTFIWAMGDEAAELTLDNSGEVVIYEDSKPMRRMGPVKLTFGPNAGSTVHIATSGEPKFSGLDEANWKVARAMWESASAKFETLGTPVEQEPKTWRAMAAEAERMEKEYFDAMRTTTAKYVSDVKIDGDLSEWAGVQPVYPAVEILRDFSRKGDFRDGEFHLGWDDENLYIAAKVKDDMMVNNYRDGGIWQGDGIEVFIELDPENDPSMHSYDRDTWQFLFSPTNADGEPDKAVAGNPGLKWGYKPEANKVASKKTDGGWTIECAINRMELGGWEPKAGERIGFTFALDLSSGSGRDHQYLWYGKGDVDWNRKRLGRLLLVK